MDFAIFITILIAAAATGFLLKWKRMHWLLAWFVSSLVIPASIYVQQLVSPSEWFGVAVFFGALYSLGLGGIGVLVASLMQRKTNNNGARTSRKST